MKANERLATVLGITQAEATERLKSVQDKFRPHRIPKYDWIVEEIESDPGASDETIVSRLGPRMPALIQADETTNRQVRRRSRTKKARVARRDISSHEDCPHGIPFWRKCAICDPKGFADYGSI